ncbi:MAG: oxygen-dependent coproporphyrinogen oxidase, partial [Chitinophagales bacterium]|nr:oxygen-dependent coproporphyrinogen oxidase [Chitinophagales bacterium]
MILDRFYISEWFRNLQDAVCNAMEQTDGKGIFIEDLWQRADGGGGRTRVFQNANIIEKGCVNFSSVHGRLPEKIAASLNVKTNHDFFATGVSIVMHPYNPFVPIIHMNVRYFEISSGEKWFGGGIDLTPHYIDAAQAKNFHTILKAVCDKHHKHYYTEFKCWADNYFFIRHRNETRGIGGIFFDKLSATKDITLDDRFHFVQDVGDTFIPVYIKLMQTNKDIPYGKAEKKWQLIRRGRYVEFNLVYDNGTKFGLETDGRTESILLSMPPEATWIYNFQPLKGSREENTQNLLQKNIDWS